MDAKAAIREFVLGKLVAEGTLRDDESFWDTRAVDSLGIVRLIHFLEKTFGLKIPGRDVTTKTFFSIDSVCGYVEARLKTSL
jgi:acyl carrier protein